MSAGLAPKLEDYSRKYQCVRLNRKNGILEVRFHTGGGSMKWGPIPHRELGYLFADIAEDLDNEAVIITGEGSDFCTGMDIGTFDMSPKGWELLRQEGRRLINNLLDIQVPVIGVVNGPAHIHAELVLLSNIVICTPEATFKDLPHFPGGAVPGDGVHVVWPALLGPTRGSYFLLTGQVLSAQQAQTLGVVNEIVARDQLMTRAWAIAEDIVKRTPMVRRYSRILLTQEMKRLMHDHLSHGLTLEALAGMDMVQGR